MSIDGIFHPCCVCLVRASTSCAISIALMSLRRAFGPCPLLSSMFPRTDEGDTPIRPPAALRHATGVCALRLNREPQLQHFLPLRQFTYRGIYTRRMRGTIILVNLTQACLPNKQGGFRHLRKPEQMCYMAWNQTASTLQHPEEAERFKRAARKKQKARRRTVTSR